MTDKIDMSLDDIIKRDPTIPSLRRGRMRGARNAYTQRSGGPIKRDVQKTGGFKTFGGNKPYSRPQQQWNGSNRMPTRLMVSNLDYGVSDNDIIELFATFGSLKRAAVHYDYSGRSLGTAEVVFEMRYDAITALNKCNGVPLDGRSMRIQIVGESFPRQYDEKGYGDDDSYRKGPNKGSFAGRGRSGRGSFGGNRNRGANQRSENRSQLKTAEQLNAELDEYNTNRMDIE